jgi:hypothetical protein
VANPTIASYFGANAQLLTNDSQVNATAANPAIVIRFTDFNAEGLGNVASFEDPDRLLAAIIKKTQAWLSADNSEDPGTEVATPAKSFTTRNSVQVLSWLYYVNFFTPDPTAAQPDPDEVV